MTRVNDIDRKRRQTQRLSPQEIRDLVRAWKDGSSIRDLSSIAERAGKPKEERYFIKLVTGSLHQELTGLRKTSTYLEACSLYQKRRKEDLFSEYDEEGYLI